MSDTLCMREAALAMAYVPWQEWECPLNEEEALIQGSAFPSLILPFYGNGGSIR